MNSSPPTSATFYFDLGSPFAYLTAERIEAVSSPPAPPVMVWEGSGETPGLGGPGEKPGGSTAAEMPGAPTEMPGTPTEMPGTPAGMLGAPAETPGTPAELRGEPAATPGRRVVWQPVSLGALFKLAGRSSWSLGDPDRRRAGIAEVQRRAERYGLPPLRWPEPWPSNYLFAMRACTYAFQRGRGREFARAAFRAAFQRGRDLGVPEHVLAVAGEIGLDPREVEQATADPAVKAALRTATEDAHRRGVFGVPTVAVGGELFWGDDRLEQAAVCTKTSPGCPPSSRTSSSSPPTAWSAASSQMPPTCRSAPRCASC